MTRHVFDRNGTTLSRKEQADPVCGEDLCDSCGDCLHCYGYEDSCRGGSSHYWVVYEDPAKGTP